MTPSYAIELLPVKAFYLLDEPVSVDVITDLPDTSIGTCRLRVTHLEEVIRAVELSPGTRRVELGSFPPGGYGVDLVSSDGGILASTAFDVWVHGFERPRYGFVAHHDGTDPEAIARHFRRLHLACAQFYDWAWRYTELNGPEQYADTLGNRVSLPAIRSVISALHDAGVSALGYVALYGVPVGEWERWAPVGLYQADGAPYGLGEDFLRIVDPGNLAWQAHLVPQFAAARQAVGFDGFHLDQYGGPKQALRADGTVADLTNSFPSMIAAIAASIPQAPLIFNNVNGFPLEHTAKSPQAAMYSEVWAPRTDLRDLVDLIACSRSAGSLPTLLAAYLSVYADQPARVGDRTAQLTMSSIFSSGATQLLNGEAGSLLTGPYYPDNHRADDVTIALMTRWQDFLVRYGDLLVSSGIEEVTGQYFSGVNEEIHLDAPGLIVSIHPDPGTVWTRVKRVGSGMIIHLINLTNQTEAGWDTPKQPFAPVIGLDLRYRKLTSEPLQAYWADPDQPGPMAALPFSDDSVTTTYHLPPLTVWGCVWIPFPQTPDRALPQAAIHHESRTS